MKNNVGSLALVLGVASCVWSAAGAASRQGQDPRAALMVLLWAPRHGAKRLRPAAPRARVVLGYRRASAMAGGTLATGGTSATGGASAAGSSATSGGASSTGWCSAVGGATGTSA